MGQHVIYPAGPSQPIKPPSQSSIAAGSAAMARLDAQSQSRPPSTSSQPMKKKERVSDVSSTSAAAQTSHSSTYQTEQESRRLDSQVSLMFLF